MKTFSINTFGCKVNQYESQQIRELLERLGLDQVETFKKPDVVVINTCCVTHTASAKSRRYIRKAQKLNSDAAVVVCGCLPSVEIGELGNPGKNVHLIRHRNNLVDTLNQIINSKTNTLDATALSQTASPSPMHRCGTEPDSKKLEIRENTTIKAENGPKARSKNKLTGQLKLLPLTSFKGHTRAFLKVQDGCDRYCSYCIIPKTRPYVQSKPLKTVLEEAQMLVEAGHKEIVVTGIFLGAYGEKSVRRKSRDEPQNGQLAELLENITKVPNLARVRLSSLEPADVTERLVDTFCKHRNIMPHLHLSLQSGSNAILKKMGRQYNADEFKEKVELIKSRLDRPAITTDIIVGFPGETDVDFQKTVDLAKETGFAKMHIFKFSPRKGTAAADMQPIVDNRVMKERSQILRDLDAELGHKFRQQFIGENDTVLLETSPSTTSPASGRSERYFMVQLEKAEEKLEKNELVKVKLIQNSENGMIGQAI